MGYDIVVFDKRRRYHSVEELNANFHKLDDRDESKDYNDYRNSTPELQNWFLAIKDRVRPLNGEFAPPESEIGHRAYHEADYVFGRESIWVEFAYSDMDRLYDTVKDQARRNDVAFWDVSGTGAVFYPDGTVLQTAGIIQICDAFAAGGSGGLTGSRFQGGLDLGHFRLIGQVLFLAVIEHASLRVDPADPLAGVQVLQIGLSLQRDAPRYVDRLLPQGVKGFVNSLTILQAEKQHGAKQQG